MKDEYIHRAGYTWTAATAIRRNPIAPDPGAMMLGAYLEGIGSGQSRPVGRQPVTNGTLEPADADWPNAAQVAGGIGLVALGAFAVFEFLRKKDS